MISRSAIYFISVTYVYAHGMGKTGHSDFEKKSKQVYKLWVIISKPDACCCELNMKWGFYFNARDWSSMIFSVCIQSTFHWRRDPRWSLKDSLSASNHNLFSCLRSFKKFADVYISEWRAEMRYSKAINDSKNPSHQAENKGEHIGI